MGFLGGAMNTWFSNIILYSAPPEGNNEIVFKFLNKTFRKTTKDTQFQSSLGNREIYPVTQHDFWSGVGFF